MKVIHQSNIFGRNHLPAQLALDPEAVEDVLYVNDSADVATTTSSARPKKRIAATLYDENAVDDASSDFTTFTAGHIPHAAMTPPQTVCVVLSLNHS